MGGLVGMAATVFLHWVLQSVAGRNVDIAELAVYAVIFGLPAGLIIGAMFGSAMQLAVKTAMRKNPDDGKAP